MITTVAIGTSAAAVSGIQLRTCTNNAFSAAVWSDLGGWPVGIGNGTGGAAVIETYLPLARLAGAGPVRVGVISTDGQVSDALTGGANGQPLVLALNGDGAGDPAVIPVLNPWTLGLLIALLGGALRYGRRWPGATRLLVVVMAGAGLAWAAFVRDGQTNDWAGVAPLATQTSTVTGPSKIVALFGKAEAGNLNFRIDTGITVTSPPTNQAPQVNAGADQTITLPANANLAGTVTDDGLPNPPATVTVSWTQDSGPGTVTFGNANVASTTATFSTAGTYVLRLTANDSALSTSDTMQVTVNPAGGGGGSPPNPETVTPPVDPTVATTTYAATQFLYTAAVVLQTWI